MFSFSSAFTIGTIARNYRRFIPDPVFGPYVIRAADGVLRRVWSHFQLETVTRRVSMERVRQAASLTSTVICLPRTPRAAWIFSGFDACSGSSKRRITRS